MLVNNSKKRQDNLIIGRHFDYYLLDMVEFYVTGYRSMQEIGEGLEINPGARPVLLFLGDVFESNSDYQRIQNLLNDF